MRRRNKEPEEPDELSEIADDILDAIGDKDAEALSLALGEFVDRLLDEGDGGAGLKIKIGG